MVARTDSKKKRKISVVGAARTVAAVAKMVSRVALVVRDLG